MPQDDGSSIPFDISVTACIPSIYHHIVLLMKSFGIELIDTTFNYSVKYRGGVYAHDFDSDLSAQLRPEIASSQRILRRLHWFGHLTRAQSRMLNALNPFNYISVGTVLNLAGLSADFRYKILKPMFVNLVLATNVFDMPASLFVRYLEFFDIETATPMRTWDQGTRRIYDNLSANFQDKLYLNRPVHKVYRQSSHIVVEDEDGVCETFDEVIFACNANQTLMILEKPSFLERDLLSTIRYDSELHNHAVVHSDASILPDNEVKPLETRSNHIEQYGARPENYDITYIMHNQQPWANRSDRPCLVTYNPTSHIDEQKIIKRWWFQHVVHNVRHMALPIHLFRVIQGRAAHLALRRAHASQQPGNLPGERTSHPKTARRRVTPSTIPKQGARSTTTAASCTAPSSTKPPPKATSSAWWPYAISDVLGVTHNVATIPAVHLVLQAPPEWQTRDEQGILRQLLLVEPELDSRP